ncbi:hypothetical protein ACRJ4W_07400 [Streptomyces sp. GLT-R25]
MEQSRAVAEVQAAVIVARQFPRNEAQAIAKMRTGFAQHSLAVRSFFRFRRGTSNVSGETIQFAKELARCWTNIHYGVHELRRDDAAGESEMQAWAWDLETNERASTTFIVPHTRWTKDSGGTRLEDPRDVYENNSNNGARRLREMIFSVLPDWSPGAGEGDRHQHRGEGTGEQAPRAARRRLHRPLRRPRRHRRAAGGEPQPRLQQVDEPRPRPTSDHLGVHPTRRDHGRRGVPAAAGHRRRDHPPAPGAGARRTAGPGRGAAARAGLGAVAGRPSAGGGGVVVIEWNLALGAAVLMASLAVGAVLSRLLFVPFGSHRAVLGPPRKPRRSPT